MNKIEYNLFPSEYTKNWIKNNNPLSGFIFTKKIKGFIPSKNGFLLNQLFYINTENWSFKNSEIIEKKFIEIMDEFFKFVDINSLNDFFSKTSDVISNNLEDIKPRLDSVNKIVNEYSKDKKFLTNIMNYIKIMFFVNSNYSTCYYFKELRSKKIEKLSSYNQRFLIKNNILIISIFLGKTDKEIIDFLKKAFKDEFKVEDVKKEIDLFRMQSKSYNEIFNDENNYKIEFTPMNPMFHIPLLNVPVGTEVTGKNPFLYMQASPIFMLTLVSDKEDKRVEKPKEGPIGSIIMNDIISRKNLSTEAYYYKGAVLNYFKIIKPDLLDSWMDLKDYTILIRMDSNDKEVLVSINDEFKAKLNTDAKQKKPDDNKKSKKNNDFLTSSIDDLYK